jgi:hypothetical protein
MVMKHNVWKLIETSVAFMVVDVMYKIGSWYRD